MHTLAASNRPRERALMDARMGIHVLAPKRRVMAMVDR
jgi:hypothetical protein